MKFNLKNHEVFSKYEIESKNIRDKKLSLKGIKSNISLPEIINDLNSSDLLNVKSKAEINSSFNKLKP